MTSFAVQLDSLIDTTSRKDSSIVSLKLVNCIFLSISLSMAVLRFWVRFVMLKSRGLDDLLLIVAVLFTISLSIASLIGEDLGLGNHIWQLSLANPTEKIKATSEITKTLYACYLTYPTAITFTKLSVMATYFRIFPQGNLRKITVSLSITALTFWVASIFAVIFTCIPVQAAWNYSVNGHCYNTLNFFMISSSFHILLDVMLCVLPIPLIWSLSIPKTQRLILLALFCGGALACISSILRLIHLRRAGNNINASTVDAIAWSIIEVDTGIICASVAALRPLYRLLILPYTSSGVKSAFQTHGVDKPRDRGDPSDQKSWLACVSEPEIIMPEMPMPATHAPNDVESSVQMPEVEESRRSSLKVPQVDSSDDPSSRRNDDAAFLTGNIRKQDYSRRKTWNIHESTPINSSVSKFSRPAFPTRSYSAYGLDLTNQTRASHLRANNIVDSRCDHLPTVIKHLQDGSTFAMNRTQNMNWGVKSFFNSEDKELHEDIYQHNSTNLRSKLDSLGVQGLPRLSWTNISEIRHNQPTTKIGLPHGFSPETPGRKIRRETVCLSKF